MPILKSTTPVTQVRNGVSRRIIHGQKLMLVVIDFANGPWAEPEPMHQHVHEQATYIAEGEIILFCEGEKEEHLCRGDMFYVPPNKKHGIRLLSASAKLVDSFSPVREDFIK
jgi:quercetin dioxygenase-like cupin family protein